MSWVKRFKRWLRRRWQRRLQRIDEKILFPIIRQHAKSEEHAEKAIAFHKAHDEAWEELCLTRNAARCAGDAATTIPRCPATPATAPASSGGRGDDTPAFHPEAFEPDWEQRCRRAEYLLARWWGREAPDELNRATARHLDRFGCQNLASADPNPPDWFVEDAKEEKT